MQHQKRTPKSIMGIRMSWQEGGGGYTGYKSFLVGSVSHMHSPATFPNNLIYLRQASGGKTPLLSAFRGCCLHLVVFIKMAAASYLNVNYCYDTQDNLTCFGNLFFPLIRCSNWKIFQSVTTVLKVTWWRGRDLCHRNSTIT